ncbi:hypothetical protein SAMN05421541_104495 [Actinoplanes philippinensis]|uniref:Uncharacterized protein n=1 Tax=Actinoplanes philippinensis TaxID=35752 RepID=A0A1I2EIT2_9ACTN|nr:hypothetical protein [Actinoplanes philippinensis]SFE92659.1 hypothetical protein SAMN05421541_104495 [Actinoplanes philippinensis]
MGNAAAPAMAEVREATGAVITVLGFSRFALGAAVSRRPAPAAGTRRWRRPW